jgi:uncharacterized spore protein YtfJ
MSQETGRESTAEAPESAMALLAEGFARLDAAARAESTVGTAHRVGERMAIPLGEVWYGGGFGLGSGRGTGDQGQGSGTGGGAGFGGRVRPVAVVDVGPEGVRVRPVVDVTALGLALVGVALAIVPRLVRARERRT